MSEPSRVLVTGSRGRLGTEIMKRFPGALAPSRQDLDLTDDIGKVSQYVTSHEPAIVIHAAALADVRRCEQSREVAWSTNVLGTARLVEACARVPDVHFIYISTACVFDGERGGYVEDDVPYPKNFYALTKLAGEFAVSRLPRHLIVRTNFVTRERWPYPRAFVDRFGTYLFADDVAKALDDVITARLTGIVHITGDEKLSMYDVAHLTTPDVLPMTMADYQGPALTRDMTLRSKRWTAYRMVPQHLEQQAARKAEDG